MRGHGGRGPDEGADVVCPDVYGTLEGGDAVCGCC